MTDEILEWLSHYSEMVESLYRADEISKMVDEI
jgi:hypothetical protein